MGQHIDAGFEGHFEAGDIGRMREHQLSCTMRLVRGGNRNVGRHWEHAIARDPGANEELQDVAVARLILTVADASPGVAG